MIIKILELIAFGISAAALGYGIFHLSQKDTPKFFRLYVCAAGCYVLEELWVIVNSLLGNGAEDGLVTVRLLGIFGCLCFMLSANAHEFDRIVDDGNNRRPKLLAFAAPAVLLICYVLFVLSPANTEPKAAVILGFFSISPALFASYFNLKHLLLPNDAMGFLKSTRWINCFALICYAANFLYPLLNLYCPPVFMSIYDLLLALIMSAIMILCRKGALKWKTSI